MPVQWKLFRILCIFQIVGALVLAMVSLVDSLKTFALTSWLGLLHWVLVICLAALGISILYRNYPHTPVSGPQKSTFNRLYLANFLFLSVFFGFVISGYHQLQGISSIIDTPLWKLDIQVTWPFILVVVLLLGQFLVLYGLFVLRRELYQQVVRKQFEFEEIEK